MPIKRTRTPEATDLKPAQLGTLRLAWPGVVPAGPQLLVTQHRPLSLHLLSPNTACPVGLPQRGSREELWV